MGIDLIDRSLLDNLKSSLPELKITAESKVQSQKVVLSSYYKDNIRSVFKVIKTEQPEEKTRGLREIGIQSSLKSEYYLILYDFGEYNNGPENIFYVVEEYISVHNLRDILKTISPSKYLGCMGEDLDSLVCKVLKFQERACKIICVSDFL